MRLTDMPTEILCEILCLLPPCMILKCVTVSRTWHKTILASPALQYVVQLWKDGLVPGHDSSSSSDKSRALDERRRAWANLAWTSQTVVGMPRLSSCRAFELRSGILAIQYRGPDFSTLPLQDLDSDAPVHTHDLGIDMEQFEDFTIDPPQDLLVVFLHSAPGQAGLVFETLSDHQPHPLARCPTITFPAGNIRPVLSSIQIADDVIGASVFKEGRFSLCFWNWRQGEWLAESSGRKTPSHFRFISSRAFIEAVPRGNGCINICIIDAEDGCEGARIIQIATLRLPELSTGYSLTFAGVHGGACCHRPMPKRPFFSADARRIYLLHLQYNYSELWTRLFVHHRTLYEYVSRYERDGPYQPLDVPWEDWGPQQTRLLHGDDYGWAGHTYGERVVLPIGDSIQLLDFNPAIVGPPESSEAVAEEENGLHAAPSTLDEPFENPVATYLPYRSTMRRVDENLGVFFLDQDHIIGTNTLEDKFTVFAF
ncbi:hypothetical protein FB45DRAFT_929968 [Roridomyces roridus]|uniref:F-box domain-containing protein n=1 Tax=Roridomyces roridus TaxID=1738132 RepID=A0AAD7BGC8_9AGAR|nr:hypothetical protein FB45DRAFT_929968 [Roridomyces roridus]